LALAYLFFIIFQQSWVLVATGLLWIVVSRAIRSLSHLREQPRDLWLLPLVALTVIAIALPVKVWAFISMNKHGWLTRTATSVGGEGQSEASLYRFPHVLENTASAGPLSMKQA
jgi:N-acetylglucosaminyltransferase